MPRARPLKTKPFLDSRFDYETFTPTRIVRNAPGYITAILDREELLYPVAFSGVIMLIDPALTPDDMPTGRRGIIRRE